MNLNDHIKLWNHFLQFIHELLWQMQRQGIAPVQPSLMRRVPIIMIRLHWRHSSSSLWRVFYRYPASKTTVKVVLGAFLIETL